MVLRKKTQKVFSCLEASLRTMHRSFIKYILFEVILSSVFLRLWTHAHQLSCARIVQMCFVEHLPLPVPLPGSGAKVNRQG